MVKPSQSAGSLKELIKQAIRDLEVTPKEYQQIMDQAQDDNIVDREERALLSQFQDMLSNGTIKRVRG